MEFLSDDPTYVAGGLVVLAAVFLVALKLTQNGRYLIWAGVAFALALGVVAVERVWVTDNERIEETVYGLAQSVKASDVSGVLARLTPDVQYVSKGSTTPTPDTLALIERAVKNAKFDFLRLSKLRTDAGGQSRRGRAEFAVICGGSFQGPFNALNFGSANTSWSLGLSETAPGVWKVNRISPVSLPGGQDVLR